MRLTSASNAKITENTITENGESGAYVYNAETVEITNNTFSKNKNGIKAAYAKLKISSNTIVDNLAYGIFFETATSTTALQKNIITGNQIVFRLPASALPDSTNTLTPNKTPIFEVLGNTLLANTTIRVVGSSPNTVAVYHLLDGALNVPAGIKLNVEAGVVIKQAPASSISVAGAMQTTGTVTAPVVFTSLTDDLFGGDTNADQDATSPYSELLEA